MSKQVVMWGLVAGLCLGVSRPADARGGCNGTAVQDVAVARSGRVPGVGLVTGSIHWDGTKELTLSGGSFAVSRRVHSTGDVEITISGGAEEPVVIRVGAGTLSVVKGVRRVDGARDPDTLRDMVSGRAVAAFRERLGEYERQVVAGHGARAGDPLAPHADGFLLAAAFVASLAGDPTAVGRARDLIVQRVRGRLRAVRLEFRDCVGEYERALLTIDSTRTSCLESANSQDSWYERAAQRLLCEAEFMASALSAEGQFVSCTALLPLAKV